VGLKKVQQVMRHQRQSTTEIYVEGHYTDTKDVMTLLEFDNLKEIVSESAQKKDSRLIILSFVRVQTVVDKSGIEIKRGFLPTIYPF
jgi:hypothetical protein